MSRVKYMKCDTYHTNRIRQPFRGTADVRPPSESILKYCSRRNHFHWLTGKDFDEKFSELAFARGIYRVPADIRGLMDPAPSRQRFISTIWDYTS